jgi:hypothetical protein
MEAKEWLTFKEAEVARECGRGAFFRILAVMRYLLGILALIAAAQPCFSQTINTDAIVAFWTVVDRLEADQPLDDSLWNGYISLHGNKSYMEHNRSDVQVAEHRKFLSFVFRPSMTDSLKAAKPNSVEPGDDMLENLLYIKANERRLRAYTKVITSQDYLEACERLARKYLPAKVNPLPKDLTIYIMAMSFDAAVQPPSMYFGISIVYELDKYMKGAIAAHEFHHQMRVQKVPDIRQGRLTSADTATIVAVSMINNEGSADLVDKMVQLDNMDKIYGAPQMIHWFMDSATEVIMRLDSCIRLNATVTGVEGYVTVRQFLKTMVYSSGHIPGMYMADVIRRNGLEKELIEHNDNAFHIIYLYNEAAAKDSSRPPVFSVAAIAYLRRLEQQIY